MKKIALLGTLMMLVFAGSPAFAQFTQPEMIKEWQRAKTYTKEYLNAMPAVSYAFKPMPEIRSFAEQMLHLAWTNYFFASWAGGRQNPFDKTDYDKIASHTKEATTKAVMDSYDFIISSLQNMMPDQINEVLKKKTAQSCRGLIYSVKHLNIKPITVAK
ncbi:MAG TPA: DinB family protein [Puia sp.]|nr:DinB family protein [Puia sp.]